MTSLPLHPALVHLPLGLAFIMPALATGFAWALWKERIGPGAWMAVVALQAVLLGAGVVAMNTGEREEDRVERIVPEAAIEQHEAYAEQFVWATGVTLVLAALVVPSRRRSVARSLTVITVMGTLIVAAAAVRVGHAGGQLVYGHNAAAAYTSADRNARQVGAAPGASAADRRPHEEER